jgi:hypothetical protein
MLSQWVMDEMKSVALNDKRLDQRLKMVLSQLAERPTASIPAACGGHAEMTAAHRLFDNEKATFENILQAHADATRERLAAQSVVVLVQDATEIDLTRPSQPVKGAGPLDGGPRQGALPRLLHAFTPDGTPLGSTHAMAWTRDETAKCAGLSRAERAATPLDQKESLRWITTLQRAREIAGQTPATQFVCVADSEADIYEMFVAGAAEGRRVDWVAWAAQDRALCGENGEKPHLRERVLASEVLFTQTIQVRGRRAKVSCEKQGRRPPRESREAEVEWLLLTTLPIEDIEQVRRVIQIYTVRWMIEILFRVLKSGCRVEERRFEQIDRRLTCLAVYLIVAWRTLYACRLGEVVPRFPARVCLNRPSGKRFGRWSAAKIGLPIRRRWESWCVLSRNWAAT